MTEPDNRATELEAMLDLMPFARTLGIVLDGATPERVSGRLAHAPDLCTANQALHGGALMALADSLGAVCAYLNLPEGAQTTTVSSSTVFVRALRDGEVRAQTTPLHTGRTVIVVQTDLYDTEGRLLAQTTQTQAVLAPR